MERKSPFRDSLSLSLVSTIVPPVFRVFDNTWSVRILNHGFYRKYGLGPDPSITAIWHQDILPCLWFRRSSGRALVMISRSRDGEMVARVARRLGFRTSRGSSSRGGAEALREVTGEGHRGAKTVMVVDGPRGPAKQPKMGAIIAARQTGLPIIAIGCRMDGGVRARNWDRTRVPLPFARLAFRFTGPLRVPRDATTAQCEGYRDRLRDMLVEAEDLAHRG
ncbi:MAG: lysophospholipid acyltransferase family protein [Planctomycetota bacterium]|jgi:lysophospholipid acyltransferase (LPLAT)-like uncharacterized protein